MKSLICFFLLLLFRFAWAETSETSPSGVKSMRDVACIHAIASKRSECSSFAEATEPSENVYQFIFGVCSQFTQEAGQGKPGSELFVRIQEDNATRGVACVNEFIDLAGVQQSMKVDQCKNSKAKSKVAEFRCMMDKLKEDRERNQGIQRHEVKLQKGKGRS